MWTYWDNDIKVEYSKYDCLYAVGLVLLSKYLISIKADSVISGFCKTAQRMQLVKAVIRCVLCQSDNGTVNFRLDYKQFVL